MFRMMIDPDGRASGGICSSCSGSSTAGHAAKIIRPVIGGRTRTVRSNNANRGTSAKGDDFTNGVDRGAELANDFLNPAADAMGFVEQPSATTAAIAIVGALPGPNPKKLTRGFGDIGSHGTVDTDVVLNAADKWLGNGYKEIAPGVFRNGQRQFRMTGRDLLPTHGKIGPHVHFEQLGPGGTVIEDLHIPKEP